MVASDKRVLVVDDEPIVRQSYKAVLSEDGYSVRTARSGRDALAACRASRFDVVLADLKMPDMDGLEVTRAVKREFPDAKVLIITGYPTPQSAEQARGLGVFDYLTKPLTPEKLSSVTAAALAAPAGPMAAAETPEETAPAATVVPVVTGEDSAGVANTESTLKTLGVLAVAPLIGLAYVMFLPILGFGMMIGVLGTGLVKKLGWARVHSE